MLRRTSFLLAFSLALASATHAAAAPRSRSVAVPPSTPGEREASAAFAAARAAGPPSLRAFLERMPKGADLHMHLSGAVYAETFLKNAAEDQLCVDPARLVFVKNTGMTKSAPAQPVCPEGSVAAATVFKDQKLYDALVDVFSMRSFVPSTGVSGHDWFFATFGHFDLPTKHTGEWLDEVARRAAAQNVQYLEIMHSPVSAPAIEAGNQLGWPGGSSRAELAHLRDQLLANPRFHDTIAADRAEIAAALAERRRLEGCGTANALPACAVEIRFLGQVARAFPPQRVFAQTLLYFELASADPAVVGINFVQPEDNYTAMSEYHRQMLMLDYLHSVYPKVHISLHAGELTQGLVPPEGLRFHIREAVELGQAERIGHGVDIMYETDPNLLLKELADRHVMIEINLTSNDVILGVSTNRHSLPAYLAAHVPVALSTDDEGVSRIDLTHEYTRAVLDFGLTYLDLKRLARTSLEHSFLPGSSLWLKPDEFTRSAPPCARHALGSPTPNPSCSEFLRSSPRAAQQWELERRYRAFESALP